MLSSDNLIIPDQTFYVDEDFSKSVVKNLKLVDGTIEAGPIDFQVPIDILEASFVMNVKDGKSDSTSMRTVTFRAFLAALSTTAMYLMN